MSLRDFTTEQRVLLPRHHIDMGFINHRRIFTTFGLKFHHFFESKRKQGDDHLTILYNDHILVTYVLIACKKKGTKTLGEVLNNPQIGDLFCSTEEILPCPDVYNKGRVTSVLKVPFETDWKIELNYSTEYIVADTGKLVLSEGGTECVIAGIYKIQDNIITAHPLVIGAPSFDHPLNSEVEIDLSFMEYSWYEFFPEDINEFSKLKDTPSPSPEVWQPIMRQLSEASVKEAFCKLLNDISKKDWGGEINDHFASLVHLAGERVTAAFLLKGPSHFKEMVPKHLGKNADQIYRLAASPSQVLIVQHAHNIGEAVRETLRAFAVNPANPRRYCFIDGRDTYRLLKAYGLLTENGLEKM